MNEVRGWWTTAVFLPYLIWYRCGTGVGVVQVLVRYRCGTGVGVVQVLVWYRCWYGTGVVQVLVWYRCWYGTGVVQVLVWYRCGTGVQAFLTQIWEHHTAPAADQLGLVGGRASNICTVIRSGSQTAEWVTRTESKQVEGKVGQAVC